MMATKGNSDIMPLIPDIEQAERFLKVLLCLNQTVFQTFASREGDKIIAAFKLGSLRSLKDWLTAQNNAGGGVYFVVNQTDGEGRKRENIKKVRAVFIDLDGAPIAPVLKAAIQPQAIIESSPGHYQAFWRCKGVALYEFTAIQSALARKFNGDKTVKNLDRVMRLPGFYHLKKEPFMSRIYRENVCLPYKKEEIVEKLELKVDWLEGRKGFEFDDSQDVSEEKIKKPLRHKFLLSAVVSLKAARIKGRELFDQLMKINQAECWPPLPEYEVAKLAGWAVTKNIKPRDVSFSDVVEAVSPVNDDPNLKDWHSLANTKLPPSQWVVQGILPQGLILFIGKAKTGKSWLTQALALQIAKGLPVLGHFPSNKGEVCVLALEDTPQRFQARMMKLLGGDPHDAPKNATYAIRWPRLPDCIAPIEKWAESCQSPRLLVIDVLNKMRPRPSKSDTYSDAYQKDYAFMQPFHNLAHKHKIAIVMIHHEKKGDSDDDYSRGSGSAALGAAADGLWILNHSERGENRGSLIVSGRDFESNEFSLEFDKSTGLWRCVGTEKEVKNSETQDRILSVMRSMGRPVSPSEIAAAGEIKISTTKSALYRLMEKGMVTKSVTHGYKYVLLASNPDNSPSFLGEEM